MPEGKTLPRWVFLQKTAAAALVSALSKRMLPSCKMCFARPKSSASESYWFIYPAGEFSSNNENDSSKKKISLGRLVFHKCRLKHILKLHIDTDLFCTNVFTFYH